MQITTRFNLANHVSYVKYKGKMEIALHRYKVYICQPANYIDEGLKHLDIWSGYIMYITNDITRNTGKFMFVIDKDNDETYKDKISENKVYLKLCPIGVNTLLGIVNSESNCRKYPNLKRETLYLEEDNKRLFTTREEAEQYINDIKNNVIQLPEKEHIVTIITTEKDENGNIIEKKESHRLPDKNKIE